MQRRSTQFRVDANVAFIASLVLLFLISFAIPLAFAAKLRGYLFDGTELVDSQSELFKDSVHITAASSLMRITDSEGLEPISGKDFLLVGWFYMRRLPVDGEKIFLFEKFDADSASRRGYAAALARSSDALHPAVYWKDDSGRGGWNTFSEVSLLPRQWFMLALSFRGGRFLGMHVGLPNERGEYELHLAGGFEFEEELLPGSLSPLAIGSVVTEMFRGRVGPIGVFLREDLSEDLNPILQDLLDRPLRIPTQLGASSIELWSPGTGVDEGPRKRSIEVIGNRKGASGKKRGV